MAEELTDKYFDVRRTEYVYGSDDPKNAVNLILKLIKNQRKKQKKKTGVDYIKLEEKKNWKIYTKKSKEDKQIVLNKK